MERSNRSSGVKRALETSSDEANSTLIQKVKNKVSGLLSTSLRRLFQDYNEGDNSILNSINTANSSAASPESPTETFVVHPPPAKRFKPTASPSGLFSQYNYTYTPPTNTSIFVNSNEHRTNRQILHPNDFTIHSQQQNPGPSSVREFINLNPITDSNNSNVLVNGEPGSDSSESSDHGSVDETIAVETTPKTANTSQTMGSKSALNTTSESCVSQRSLFLNASLPHIASSSLSSRQPSFNAAMFGSTSFVDRSLTTRRIYESPFYRGRTMYGGAASAKSSTKTADLFSPARSSIQIKPVEAKDKKVSPNASLSRTAKRIFDVLEQFSSPVAEAKKIPLSSSLKPYGRDQRKLVTGTNKELVVPQVQDLLQAKMKQNLQEKTLQVKEVAAKSTSVQNEPEYSLPILHKEDKPTRKAKMRSRITTIHHEKLNQSLEEIVPEVNLPEVPLPITVLPKFDITFPPPVPATASTSISATNTPPKLTQPATTKVVEVNVPKPVVQFKFEATKAPTVPVPKTIDRDLPVKSNNDFVSKMPFTFAAPIVVEQNKCQPVTAVNNFKFSDPLPAKEKQADGGTKTVEPKNVVNTKPFGSQFLKNESQWECSVCMIRNKNSDLKCVACETLKPAISSGEKPVASNLCTVTSSSKISSDTFGNIPKFVSSTENKSQISQKNEKGTENLNVNAKNSMPFKAMVNNIPSTWECSVCLVPNNLEATKCICCESAKPGSDKGNKQKLLNSFSQTPFSSSIISSTNETIPTFTFGIPSATVTSSSNSQLETKQPETKKKWECPSCMVFNDPDKTSCICCETAKPGTNKLPAATSDVSSTTSQPAFTGFSFGVPAENRERGITNTLPQVQLPAADMKFTFGVKPSTPEIKKDNINIETPKNDRKEPDKAETKAAGATNSGPGANFVYTPKSTEPTLKLGSNEKAESKKTSIIPPNFNFAPPSKMFAENKNKEAEVSTSSTFASTPALFSFGTSTKTSTESSNAQGTADSTPSLFSTEKGSLPNKSLGELKKEEKPLPVFPALTSSIGSTFTWTPPATNSSLIQRLDQVPSKPTGGFSFGTNLTTPNSLNSNPAVNASLFTFGSSSTKSQIPSSIFGGDADKVALKTFGNSSGEELSKKSLPSFPISNEELSKPPTTSFGFTASSSQPSPASIPAFETPKANSQSMFAFTGTNAASAASKDIFKLSSYKQNGEVSALDPKAPVFKFGSTDKPQSTSGFSFNAGATTGATSPTTPFVFGAGNSTTSEPATPKVPVFSADAKPMFKFTGGTTPSFTSTADQSTAVPVQFRKIKKAFRRIQPR